MRIALRAVLLFFAAVFAVQFARAADDPLTPNTAKGVQVISVEQGRDLIGKAEFFDMRAAVNYGKGHIKGAVPLPYGQKSEKSASFDGSKDGFDMTKLPRNKASPIVFYSDGPTGWKSYKAAILAARAGYTKVKWIRDGTSGWTEKGFTFE
jgi:rhodanese-related sulfurtransferase